MRSFSTNAETGAKTPGLKEEGEKLELGLEFKAAGQPCQEKYGCVWVDTRHIEQEFRMGTEKADSLNAFLKERKILDLPHSWTLQNACIAYVTFIWYLVMTGGVHVMKQCARGHLNPSKPESFGHKIRPWSPLPVLLVCARDRHVGACHRVRD